MTENVAGFAGDRGKSSQSLTNLSQTSSDELKLPPFVICGLGASAITYAFWLNTPTGRKWDAEHNWFVVMIGVMLTLGWLALTDPKAAIKAFACFIISGLPVIFRALFLDSERKESLVNRVMQSQNNEQSELLRGDRLEGSCGG